MTRACFLIDNSLTDGEFALLLRRYGYGADFECSERDEFWRGLGFNQKTIASEWKAPNREILRQVVSMEFPLADTDAIMEEISGLTLSYHYDVFYYIG